MLDTPFSPWPTFSDEEITAVSSILRSGRVNYWTGKECREFEKEYAEWSRCRHAIALANGTVALDLALKVLDVGPGDEVITTPRTFLASVSSIVNSGARPVFADVDRDSQNISAATIREAITEKTKAILCVHIAGVPCDMGEIMSLATKRKLVVIEDCAQAHGASYAGQPVGSIGHVGAWSFCQDKIVTTGGEGGMLTTDDEALWSRAWSYKDHGKSWDAVYKWEHAPGFRWLHESFGTNWRMTEMQAAIGRIQLKRMPEWHTRRRSNAEAIIRAASDCAAYRVPRLPETLEPAWYRVTLFVEPERLKAGWSRDRLIAEIRARGVPCYHGICPEVYLEKAFDGTGFRPRERLSVARELGETSLVFLVHPTLKPHEVSKTCEVLRDLGRAALK